jgi:hypothetical protein
MYAANTDIVTKKGVRYGIGFENSFYRALKCHKVETNNLNELESLSLRICTSVNLYKDAYISLLEHVGKQLRRLKQIRITNLFYYGHRETVEGVLYGTYNDITAAPTTSMQICIRILTIFITLPTVTEIRVDIPYERCFIRALLDQLRIHHEQQIDERRRCWFILHK